MTRRLLYPAIVRSLPLTSFLHHFLFSLALVGLVDALSGDLAAILERVVNQNGIANIPIAT